jgi:predicted DNA-binding transcriptional regulator AlpA
MAATYEFTLRLRLPADKPDPGAWLDRLYEAGCDDATVGVGRKGFIAVMFTREAANARKAVSSAIRDVRTAIPDAELVAADPDLVNLAELARLTGCTRQNLRKYAAGEMRTVKDLFPPPALSGPESFWRLAEVGEWISRHTKLKLERELLEVAYATSKLNLRMQGTRLRRLSAKRAVGARARQKAAA